MSKLRPQQSCPEEAPDITEAIAAILKERFALKALQERLVATAVLQKCTAIATILQERLVR